MVAGTPESRDRISPDRNSLARALMSLARGLSIDREKEEQTSMRSLLYFVIANARHLPRCATAKRHLNLATITL